MKGRQYNSAADRRWQQRYQRIVERKEANWDYDQAKRERRKNNKIYVSSGFNPDRLFQGKVAVVCSSERQIRQVLSETNKKYPYVCSYTANVSDIIFNMYGPTVAFGVCKRDRFYFDESPYLKIDSPQFFENAGFTVVDFYDCCLVKDLGGLDPEFDMLEMLFEI